MAYKSTLSSENIQEALDIIHSAVVIGGGILTLDNQSSSEQISSAIGGEDGFNRILERIRGGNIALGIKVDDTTDNGIIMASIVAPKTENKFTISYLYKGIHYSDEFSLSGSTFSLSQTTEGGGLDSIFYTFFTGNDSQYVPTSDPYTFYLTEEKYNELYQAAKNSKIIRAIYTCGVFYSTSILWTSLTSDKLRAIYMGRGTTIGTTMNSTGPEYQPGYDFIATIEDNTDEEHEEPYAVILKTTPSLTKEFIEEIFTGNITTHTHDTTYAAQELETDVWDGTTVSTSWSGSGTEEDPFLIQSCADYIYFLIGKIDAPEYGEDITSADMRYVKITKNLDFDSKKIPTVQINILDSDYNKYVRSYILLDGNGCIVKNFSVETTPSIFEGDVTLPIWYLPAMMLGFVHDINFVGVKWKVPLGNEDEFIPIIASIGFANVVFDLTVETTGEYDDVTLLPVVYNYLSQPGMETEVPTARIYQDYVAEKGCFFGIDIKVQSIPQNGLVVGIYSSNPFSGYDMSLYNWEGGNFSGSSIGQNMALSIEGNYGDFRLSTLSSGKFFYQPLKGDSITVEAEVISPEDLKSQSYINKINTEHQILALNPDYDIPLIGSMQIENDGYIRQSLFNKYQEKIASLEAYKNKQLTTYRILDMPGSSASSEGIKAFVDNFRNDLATQGLNYENTLFYILSDGVKPVIIDDVPNELTFTYFRGDTCYCIRYKKSGSVWSVTKDTYDFIDKNNVLAKNNMVSYTPTADYHPATKKYVDDNSVSASEVLTKTNKNSYTPTSDYHPATKKYIDDLIQDIKPSELSITTDLSIPVFDSLDDAYAAKEEVLEKRIFIIKELKYDNEPFLTPGVYTTKNNVLFLPKRTDYSNDYLFTFNVTQDYISCDFIYDIQNNTLSASSYFINGHEDFDYSFRAGVSGRPDLSRPTELTTIKLPLNSKTSYAIYKKIIIASFSKGELYVDIRWQDGTDPDFKQIIEKIRIDGLQRYISVDNIIGFLFTYNNVRYIIKMDWDQGTATLDKIN